MNRFGNSCSMMPWVILLIDATVNCGAAWATILIDPRNRLPLVAEDEKHAQEAQNRLAELVLHMLSAIRSEMRRLAQRRRGVGERIYAPMRCGRPNSGQRTVSSTD